MTEVHPTPDKAWSDAKQQITPAVFQELIASLVLRSRNTDDIEYQHHIDHLRQEIDELDTDMMNLLEQRMRIADKIGEYKKAKNIAILQSSRWQDILETAVVQGQTKGLSRGFVERFFKAIHQESINHQEMVMRGKGAELED